MEYREVTIDNLKEVIALKVSDAQEGLVADNLYTVAQVGLVPDTRCCGVYVDDVPVGFFALQWEVGHIYLWRLMVGEDHQGQGIGSRIIRKFLDDCFSDPSIELVDLGVQRREGGAEPFYLKCGFVPTEEESHGDWGMKMTRQDYLAMVKAHQEEGKESPSC